MRKTRKDRGFSLAEMLIVLAIIAVLMGVSFVAVQNHQRSMTRLEFDTIAKEIFVAAQNHLTAAESQGYLKETINYGYPGTRLADDDPTADVYYIVSGGGDGIRELMLPDYALDPTVLSGSFLIRYQPSSATVLDVFYSKITNGTFLTVSGVALGQGDYAALMGTDPNYRQGGEKTRENYKGGVIGWYGGAKALPMGQRLQAPTFEVINKEKLLVKVSIPAAAPVEGYCVKLIVTGKTSKAEAYFSLIQDKVAGTGPRFLSADDHDTIVLDSITEEKMQFAELAPNKGADFIPGEDLSIKAVAYSTKVLANVAMSAEKTTNSLFADPYPYTAGKEVLGSDVEKGVSAIANIRHLENLDYKISKFNPSALHGSEVENQGIQLRDLSWTEFMTNTNGDLTKIYNTLGNATNSTCYYPVSPNYELAYDGNNHKISEVKVNCSGEAGIFGTLNDGSVSNLLVLDSDITSSSTSSPGAAGGLIGSMTGTTVERCAANGIVSSSGAAGGLIGSASGGSVTACYSAGHTDGTYASYYTNGTATYGTDGKPDDGIYNIVAASGEAGGLIGSAGNTGINCSYSTCSVKGNTAGGFVGSGSGIIDNCYATGLVNGTTEGAFAGSYSGNASNITGSYYYEIINERKDKNGAFTYLEPCSGSDSYAGITALDASAKTYNDFSLPSEDESYAWQAAVPYDTALKTYYTDKDGEPLYNLRTVAQLGATLEMDSKGNVTAIVATHYGDWPAPEIFVINTNS